MDFLTLIDFYYSMEYWRNWWHLYKESLAHIELITKTLKKSKRKKDTIVEVVYQIDPRRTAQFALPSSPSLVMTSHPEMRATTWLWHLTTWPEVRVQTWTRRKWKMSFELRKFSFPGRDFWCQTSGTRTCLVARLRIGLNGPFWIINSMVLLDQLIYKCQWTCQEEDIPGFAGKVEKIWRQF